MKYNNKTNSFGKILKRKMKKEYFNLTLPQSLIEDKNNNINFMNLTTFPNKTFNNIKYEKENVFISDFYFNKSNNKRIKTKKNYLIQ